MLSRTLTIWVHAAALLAAGGLTSAWNGQRQLCRRRTQHVSTIHFSTSPTQQDDTAVRAGEKGYSLLRRPVDWDPNSDPDFGVPQTLQDETSSIDSWKDEAWWSANLEKKENRAPPDITMDDEDKELDLYQRSWDTLDFEPILQALQDECLTVPARKIVQHAIKVDTPQQKKSKADERHYDSSNSLMATTVEGCQERYRAVHELRRLLTSSKTFRNRNGKQAPLSVFPLAGRALNLAPLLEDTTRLLEGPDLYDILSVLNVMEDFMLWNQELKEQHPELEYLNRMASNITLNTTFHELLKNALDDKGRLSGTTFPVVGRLRARLRALKSDILSRLETLLETPSIKTKLSLQSGGPLYSQVSGGRLVIPVETSSSNQIGIVHDSSRSGQTSYVEPTEIVGPTNELKQVESELRAEEARIWRSLTAQVQLNREGLESSIQAMAQLDLVMARLRLGESWQGAIPAVEDKGVISLRNAKHPVLLLKAMRKRKKTKLSIRSRSGGAQEDMTNAVNDIVGSDIDLGDRHQGLVLTGPNSGGKTIILKMLGLAALMARSGIPIPCKDDNPRVDFFDPILADIGDLQSVGGDLSTFSGHMLVCKAVLDQAGKNALVLMDEVGSGTDPAQGVAIAQALLEALLETGSRVAITTHYTQLKQLAVADERFAVAGMQFVRGRPTYKLLPGTVGESFALSVAERVGLPLSVLERANELLDSETRQMGDLIRELEDQKATLEEQAAELEEKKREIEQIQFKLKEENLRLEKKMLNVRREEAKAFTKKLEEKEQVLEEILRKLKSDPSGKVVAKSWQDIKFVKRDALNEAENVPSVIARKEAEIKEMNEASADLVPLIEMRDKPNLVPGDKLIVCKKGAMFGREASFIKSLSGRVEVSVNGMNVSFKLAEVALPPSSTTTIIAKYNKSRGPQKGSQSSISKAAERALDIESTSSGGNSKTKTQTTPEPVRSTVAIRTQSNTIDVRGCTLEQAKSKAESAFSSCLMSNRSVVYILHGYGTGGILRNKVRNWLKTSNVVKEWAPASAEDGGDAFTRVVLR
jgi:DNA mismatch repair protein MutS2